MAKYLDYDGMLYFWSKLKEKFASIGSAFTPKGSASSIPTLSDVAIGDVYNMSVEFTTTTDFLEGDGITYPVGTNIICVNSAGKKKWDVLAGFVDLSGYSLSTHIHDDRYYTEAEIDTFLTGKAEENHTHTASQIQGCSETLGAEGVPYVLASQGSGAEGTWVSIEAYFSLKDHNHDNTYAKKEHTHDYSDTYAGKEHSHKPSQIQGAEETASSEGTPYVLVSEGNGAEGKWGDLNSYYALKGHTHSNVTTSAAGFMSKDDKIKLNGIATGATADTAITNSEIDTILAS